VGYTYSTIITPMFDVETDPVSLRATVSFLGEDEQIRMGRIWVREGDEWVMLASTNEAHALPLPYAAISSVVTDTSAKLLVCVKFASGRSFGHPPLDGSEGSRYRTRTTLYEEVTCPAGEPAATPCGGSPWPQGYKTVEFRDTFTNGVLAPREVLQDVAVLDGREYGETWLPVYQEQFMETSGSITTLTPTTKIREQAPDGPRNGSFIIRYDAPASGKLLSRDIISMPLTFDGSLSNPKNRAAWATVTVPPGCTMSVRGQRLRSSIPW